LGNTAAESAGYAGKFEEREHILAVCEAKFAMLLVCSDQTSITEQGLSSDGGGARENGYHAPFLNEEHFLVIIKR
jgi:hypothetical protein